MGDPAGKRPTKHLVENTNYPIKWRKRVTSEDGSLCLGVVDDETNETWIQKGQEPLEELDTLIHELMHVFWHTQTFRLPDDMEESVCANFGKKFARHIKDNPGYWDYILQLTRSPS